MRNVLNFLIKYQSWFLFLVYVVISLLLLFNFNNYQQSVYLTSANAVSSSVYRISSGITGYVSLRAINQELEEQNAALQTELFALRDEVKVLRSISGDSTYNFLPGNRYSYTVASVLHSNVRHEQNYFSIDKGSADGLEPGMGVINRKGVVGLIDVTGTHTARVISVLNEKQPFSVKLQGTEYVGSLNWKKGNPGIAYVAELPRHVKFKIGDTIATSGFSTSFPAGIPVGTVMSRVPGDNSNYVTLKIRLLPDFSKLETVRIIKDFMKAEIDSLSSTGIGTKQGLN